MGIDSLGYVGEHDQVEKGVVSMSQAMSRYQQLLWRLKRIPWRINLKKDTWHQRVECEFFSVPRRPGGEVLPLLLPESDIYHLHWLSEFADYPSLFSFLRSRKAVWTLHDMNPFTGGCHFTHGCNRFADACGSCPLLSSTNENDISRKSFLLKKSIFEDVAPRGLYLVSPSNWLAAKVRQSSLLKDFPLSVIPLGINTAQFIKHDKLECRGRFNIPPEIKVVVFVAADLSSSRKGLSLLMQALEAIPDIILLTAGRNAPQDRIGRVHHCGYIESADELARLYAAADLAIIPSLEDNMPQTLLESMSCGTPVIASDNCGASDVIISGVHGSLFSANNPASLREKILELTSMATLEQMSRACRDLVKMSFSLKVEAAAYLSLYEQILSA